ncbi:MAG TPA: rhodanese-like domain-containing protein [Gemmatimonadales bacterium]|nr:rhodanese-like domain-containing protein [Gemmatimonadales bacterium]
MPNATLSANPVTEVAAAPSEHAIAHFQRLLTLETDCYDVHQALGRKEPGFVLFDVRGPDAYAAGHVPQAVHFPYRRMTDATLSVYPPDTLFVVYCAGPHCNGADRAALRLAELGRRVKKMIGGIAGWKYECYELVRS